MGKTKTDSACVLLGVRCGVRKGGALVILKDMLKTGEMQMLLHGFGKGCELGRILIVFVGKQLFTTPMK